jgi:AcrR family transcriptional regulator
MREISSQAWIEAGFDALALGGIEGVRIEVLAQTLGVTKGGFYRRFKDRRALLDEMLVAWVHERIEVIERQLALGDAKPEERLQEVVRLFAERLNPVGLDIELAFRQWARSDAGAAAAVEQVDRARLAATERVYAAMGLEPADARSRAVLFYGFLFGQGLLFLDLAPAARAALITGCVESLTAGKLRDPGG